MHDLRELHMTALKRILLYLRELWILVFFFIDHPHLSLWSTLMRIRLGALTLTDPLLGMQSSLVTTSSPGPPSARIRYLAPAQKQNTRLFPMVLRVRFLKVAIPLILSSL
jgi:hypothetical protein